MRLFNRFFRWKPAALLPMPGAFQAAGVARGGDSAAPRGVAEQASKVIEVAKVTPAGAALPEVPFKAAVEALLTKPSFWQGVWAMLPKRPSFPPEDCGGVSQPARPVEACSSYRGRLLANVLFHPVLAAIHLAFSGHRPLALSPDILWLVIAQGFANHVNANAQRLRPQLLKHSGKLLVQIRRDDFIQGSPENPWPEVFGEFAVQIRRHIGEATHDLLLPDFSTTGAVERAAAQVVLLDAMQSFFSLELMTTCGIPRIFLEGAAADWQVSGRSNMRPRPLRIGMVDRQSGADPQ